MGPHLVPCRPHSWFIHVVEAVVRTRRHGNVRNRPKTDKGVRNIDLPDVVIAFLREHRARQGEDVGLDDLVFPARDGNIMAETTMMRRLKELGPESELPTLHSTPSGICMPVCASRTTRMLRDVPPPGTR